MAEEACCLPSQVLLCTLLKSLVTQRQVEAGGGGGAVHLRKPFCSSPFPPAPWQASQVMMQRGTLWATSGRVEASKTLELLLQL